jgi:hypothetical protein
MKAIKTEIIINSIRSRRDGSLGFSAETPELTSEEKVAFMDLQGQSLNTLFEPTEYAIQDQIEVEKDVENKTQAQRVRAVLFLIWKQQGEQGEFRDFYHAKTEKYINYLKEKLE